MKLKTGMTAFITGAASGIGLALAEGLAARGINLALVDVEQTALDQAEQVLRLGGVQVATWALDVSDREGMRAAGKEAAVRFDGIDLLVNNAGVGGALGPVWDLDPTDWTWTIDVNLIGIVNGLSAIVPGMIQRGTGHVLNVASLAGLVAPPFMGPYTATKHAVVGLTEGLVQELAAMGKGVTASVACPGVVVSEIKNSERNRPDHLSPVHIIDPALTARLRAAFDAMTANAMPAALCASKLIEGIEADELYILTHEESLPAIADRLGRIRLAMNQPREGKAA